MREQFSPQNTSTGGDSRPKMPGKAHRMAIYKNREVVSGLHMFHGAALGPKMSGKSANVRICGEHSFRLITTIP